MPTHASLVSKLRNAPINTAGVRKTAYHKKKRTGGFLPAAALPFLLAASAPILGKAGSWVGSKIFGKGLIRAGAVRQGKRAGGRLRR